MSKNTVISGKLFIISGPSGAGKTTLFSKLRMEMPELVNSISATTRKPREGEVNGEDYYFLTKKDFKEKIEKDYFAEWCIVYKNYYGTPSCFLKETLKKNNDIVLEIDVQGAKKIKSRYPDSILIFIRAPLINTYKKRLESRGQDNEKVIMDRVAVAEAEISQMKDYNYEIINDKLDDAYEKLKNFIETERLKKG